MRFATAIRPHVQAELDAARESNDPAVAFEYLERAHVLGQPATREHVRVHVAMLRWAVRERQLGEIVGQSVRTIGAATKTAIGLIPTGNTGGSNVSPFRRLPVAPDLQQIIDAARR